MNSGVYAIRNTLNGNQYIGSSVDLKRREKTHWKELSKGSHHCSHLQRAYDLYGVDAFEFVVLEYVTAIKPELLKREQFWLDHTRPEYNTCLVAGSHLGLKRSPESIERMRQAQSNPEVKKRKSESLRGKKRPAHVVQRLREINTGRTHSTETKEKLSRYFTGRRHINRRIRVIVVSDETRQKLSESTKRAWENGAHGAHSDETKRKISQSLQGRKLSDEQRLQRSESMKEVWKKRRKSNESDQ